MGLTDYSPISVPSPRERGLPVGRALRRGWPLVLLAMAAALAAGLSVASRQEAQYANTAKILLNPLSQSDGQLLGIDFLRSAGDPERTAQTASVLVESNEVAREAARLLGEDWTPATVLEAVAVAPERESYVLAVTATTGDPRSAARVANSVAQSFVSLRERRVREQVETRQRKLRRDLQRIDPEDYAARDNVLDDLQDLQAPAEDGDLSLSVVQTAGPPGETVEAPRAVIGALALLGGLLVGILAALLLEALRGRLDRRRGGGVAPEHRERGPELEPAGAIPSADVLRSARESPR